MNPLLEINQLSTVLYTGGNPIRAVDGLSLTIYKGETFALLGESGCGKSMTALSIMRLLPEAGQIVEGQIKLADHDLLQLPEAEMRNIRGKRISMIFQEPMLSLNPVMTISAQIDEVLQHHFDLPNQIKQQRIKELLQQVGISDIERRLSEYPFQFSGGMKQRVMIAMALAGQPQLLIADEPTTALDVTIQAQVLNLMKAIQKNTQMSILLITHDLGVVAKMADRIAVMYAGEIIETARREAFFSNPLHPYSQKLFAALPDKNKRQHGLAVIRGNVPPLSQTFSGCRFVDRCDQAVKQCYEHVPSWTDTNTDHYVKCHLFNQPQQLVSRQTENTIPIARPPSNSPNHELLHVKDLKVHFPIYSGLLKRVSGHVKAVDGISLAISSGKTLALVGESGCGKTTVGKSILQLIPVTAGSIQFNGIELTKLSPKALRNGRSDYQIIFQDPYSSLNPKMRIFEILKEGIDALGIDKHDTVHRSELQTKLSSSSIETRIDELLQQVNLPAEAKWRYPHEFSGGQRQRIAIARALSVNPKLLVCDEPTSALDVSVQAQILNLLSKLQHDFGLAFLFITHNISVVEYLADEVAVMYLGRIVEKGTVDEVLNHAKHPYTQALLSAVPTINPQPDHAQIELSGELPSLSHTPVGCYFHPRCPRAMPICQQSYPEATVFTATHAAHCHLYEHAVTKAVI
ncbi:MAG TPA: ABC transporter ATP-binding protein [Nitrosomonas sp.]|nr:ABC transporter ATP-binding protein [Nitrosomonas sp.]